jgi:very-short-patch-repair endonuclease
MIATSLPATRFLHWLELDDRSHHRNAQRERDQRKDSFLRAAGIIVVRVTVAGMPNEQELKALVAVVPTALLPQQFARRA